MKINKNFIIENFKTIFYAMVIAILIRSLFLQPFYIPSSSMEPNLLIGDRLFVITDKLKKLIKKKFKTTKFDFFLSISDEKKYSIAYVIFQKK